MNLSTYRSLRFDGELYYLIDDMPDLVVLDHVMRGGRTFFRLSSIVDGLQHRILDIRGEFWIY